jgi:beta-propeller repeat-containing protein
MHRKLAVAAGMAVPAVLALGLLYVGRPSRFPSPGIGGPATLPASQSRDVSRRRDAARLVADYGKLPLSFEANQGQTSDQVKFLTRGAGYTLFLTSDEAVLRLRSQKSEARSQKQEEVPWSLVPRRLQTRGDSAQGTNDALRMKFLGANTTAQVTALDELPGKVNYFIGNDPTRWRANITTYAKVRYRDVYPGIDLVYYGHQGQLEYDFVVAPGADPNLIALAFEGSLAGRPLSPLRIDGNGNVRIERGSSVVRLNKPVVYQPKSSRRNENSEFAAQNSELVEGHYLLTASNNLRFELGPYDKSQPLVIDPGLTYSTFLGGSGGNSASAVKVDLAGNAFIAGFTSSADFPGTTGGFESTIPNSSGSPFVAEVNAAGSALVYATYLGGTGSDAANSLALDSSDDVYLTGQTSSKDFPVMPNPGAFQTTLGNTNGANAFVTKLNPTGSALVYSTYLGGTEDLTKDSTGACSGNNNGKGTDSGASVVVDSLGDAYVAGSTGSCDFPVSASAFQKLNGGTVTRVAFLTELKPDGTALIFSTLLGGTNFNRATSVAIDGTGAAYVTGFTGSTDFPTQTPIQATLNGTADTFVTKFAPGGATLDYSTYLGGSGFDDPIGIVVDALGDAYIAGNTFSTDFPVTATPFQAACGNTKSCANGFAAKINPAGSALVYATYLGGSQSDSVNSLAVDASGDAVLAGATTSPDFPVLNAIQSVFNSANLGYEVGTGIGSISVPSSGDGFLTVLGPAGSALVFSTYLGGSDDDAATAVAVDSTGKVYVAGNTASINFPVLPGGLQTSLSGPQDVFLSKIDLSAAATPVASVTPTNLTFPSQVVGTTSNGIGTSATPQVVTVKNTGATSLTISNIAISLSTLYAETDNCTTSAIGAGASCLINVSFLPDTNGQKSGLLSVNYVGTGSPQLVTLVGFGGDYLLSPAPTSITTNAGLTSTFFLQAVPLSGFNQTVALACGGAPTNSTCTLSPNSLTFDGFTTQVVTGTITTKANGVAPPGPLSTPRGPELPSLPWLTIWAIALLLSVSGILWAGRRRKPVFVLATAALAMLLWASCATKSTSTTAKGQGTPPGTYTITIDATWTGGTLAHSVTIPFTVQ